MSVASADAALLSAARAYASLKMSQHDSSPNTPSSDLAPSTPSLSSQPKKPIYYSRAQLLALHDSPLCVRPPELKPLSEWFGDCDLSNIFKPPSNHSLPNSNLPSNQRSTQLASPDPNSQPLSQSITSLPLLGRSQPPARNPFANFGKFGTEEFNANPFNSTNLNASSHTLNNPIKGARRIIDRDSAPHITRPDNMINEGNRRRSNDPSLPSAHKDRIGIQRASEDSQAFDSKSSNRRTLDRYIPDRDRDDDRLRNRERERERDSEREKTRRSSLNPRDGPVGDDHMNWRRSPSGVAGLQLNNNKRNPSDHHSTNPRGDKETRDPSHREKAREKILTNGTPNSHSSHRNSNHQQRVRETKENSDSYSSPIQLASSSTYPLPSRNTPPVSPNVPLTTHLSRRVKDGVWDSGQGKWEISKPLHDFHSGASPSEADAIQTWKAEMKALEAKKKLTAPASLSATADLGDRLTTLPSPLETEDDLIHDSLGTKDTPPPIQLESKSHTNPLSDSSLQPDSASDPSHRQFGFMTLMDSSSADQNDATLSHDIIESELSALPRASRFAKFFDHHKHDGPQSASLLKNDHQSDPNSPPKGFGNPSVDPENMARVLSMLQSSSKQNFEPGLDHAFNSKLQPSSFHGNNKLETSNVQQGLFNNDLTGFLQSHITSPTFSHTHGIRSTSDAAESKERIRKVDDNILNQPNAGNQFTQPATDNPAGSLTSSQSVNASANQPFNLFTTINHPSHAKSPNEVASGALRNQGGLDPQMFQLQHMLQSVNNPNNLGNIPAQQLSQERHTENQKLAFLARQLHQQRLSPSHVINQASGINNLNSLMSLNPTPSALLSHNRQGLNQFEHQQNGLDFQRVPMVAPNPAVNGAPHNLQHLNSSNGIFQLSPANAPHSSLNNLFLHQQAPAHHPGIIPPAVNFTSPPATQTTTGNVRPGPANFGHQAPQILPALQHHPINHHQQLQLQQQQLQRLQRQQGLAAGTFANHTANSNMTYPFMGGATSRGFGPGFGNVNGFGIVPLINNPMVSGSSGPQQPQHSVQQLSPSALANASGLPGLQPGGAGLSHPFQQHQLGNMPPPSASNSQAHPVHSQLDLMSLLNAGNQRRVGM